MVQKKMTELSKYVSVKARDRECPIGQRKCSEGRSDRMTEVIEAAQKEKLDSLLLFLRNCSIVNWANHLL